MRKQAIVLISAIFAIFMFAGCGEQENELNANENATVQENENSVTNLNEIEEAKQLADSLEAERKSIDKYKEIIAKSTNPDDCGVILDEYYKIACKNQVIINSVNETMDTSLCDDISDEQIKIDCKMIVPAN